MSSLTAIQGSAISSFRTISCNPAPKENLCPHLEIRVCLINDLLSTLLQYRVFTSVQGNNISEKFNGYRTI